MDKVKIDGLLDYILEQVAAVEEGFEQRDDFYHEIKRYVDSLDIYTANNKSFDPPVLPYFEGLKMVSKELKDIIARYPE